MWKNYLESYSRINYNDGYKRSIGECLNVSFTTEIFYLYFRTCFEMNPKLLLASLLETIHLTIMTFSVFKKRYISSLIKIMQEMAGQSSHLVHNKLY